MAKISDVEVPSFLMDDQGSDPSTPASGFSRVYTKADGLYVIDDAGNVTGPFAESAGAGDMVLIDQQVATGGSTANFDFTSIPGTYESLMLVSHGRSDQAASDATGLGIRFNNDSGNNYQYQLVTAADSTLTGARTTGAAQAFMTTLPAANATANRPGVNRLIVPGYARTVFHKVGEFSGGYQTGSVFNSRTGSILWTSTSAITRVTLFPQAGNFLDGSVASLYGMN